MSLGVGLGLAGLFFTWRPTASMHSLQAATLFSSLYYITAFTGVLYPGARAVDPEFVVKSPNEFPQTTPWTIVTAITFLGYVLERNRLIKQSTKTM